MEAPRSTLSSLIAVSVKLFAAKETCAKISCEAQLDGVGQEKVTGLLLSKRWRASSLWNSPRSRVITKSLLSVS